MGASDSSQSSSWGLPIREKPKLLDLLAGLVVAAGSYILLWFNFANLLIDWMTHVLSLGQIQIAQVLSSEGPVLIVELLDGSSWNLAVSSQRSGLISIAVFGLLIVFLLFPLEGSIWLKTAWLELGFLTGLTWSFIRLSMLILIAYNFGIGASKIAEFFTSPFLDFVWIVPTWAVAVSTLNRHKAGS